MSPPAFLVFFLAGKMTKVGEINPKITLDHLSH